MTTKATLFICVLGVGAIAGSTARPSGPSGLREFLNLNERECPTTTAGLASDGSSTKISVRFVSKVTYPVDVTWVDFNGKEGQRDTLQPGQGTDRNSFQGHIFRVRQTTTGILLQEHTCDREQPTTHITSCRQATENAHYMPVFKPNDVESTLSLVHDQAAPCEPAGQSQLWSCVKTLPAGEEHVPKKKFGFQEADVVGKTQECGERNLYDTTDDGYSNKKHRLGVKRVTEGPGYLKLSIKPEVMALLKKWSGDRAQFWEAEQPASRRGFINAESIGGCYANTHAFPFAMLDMDKYQHIRAAVVTHLRDVLEWWTNRTLQHTSTYGMRIYRREAMLIDHVDREDTHIASAVLQVFQDCDEDGGWPLEVVGEDGLVREVYLQPGEMVLYEGARLLHGRPMRFKGKYFGNIFSHFSPGAILPDHAEHSDL